MNIALLRNHCTLNLCSSISGVFPNNQDHRIQFIVETTRQVLAIDSHSNTSFASNQHKVFFRYFFDDNEINIQTRFFAEIYQRVLQTGPTKDRHIAWWHKYFWTDFPFSFVRRQGTQNWDSETPKIQPIAPNTVVGYRNRPASRSSYCSVTIQLNTFSSRMISNCAVVPKQRGLSKPMVTWVG